MHFKQVKLKRKIYRQSLTKHLQTFSRFRAISVHHKSNGSRLFSPENECTSCQKINNQDFKKLGNLMKIAEMLGFDEKYSAGQPNAKV